MAMATHYLHNRFKIDQINQPQPSMSLTTPKPRPEAKRALWSLASAIMLPLFLTISTNLMFGSGKSYRALTGKPFWFPPLWLIHLASIGSSIFMSLAAWLVWADGGFHEQSDALPLYVSYVCLSLFWSPLVLKIGSARFGFMFCSMHFGTLVAIYRCFKRVNPFAKDLVKPCLAWIAFLTVVTYNVVTLEKK